MYGYFSIFNFRYKNLSEGYDTLVNIEKKEIGECMLVIW